MSLIDSHAHRVSVVTACTIVARNYLAHARVLAESFRTHHPDGQFVVLLIDDEGRAAEDAAEPFRLLRLADTGLSRDDVGRLASRYDVTELATAVKPRFLRHLLDTTATDVIYLDPDIKLYGSLDDVSRLARAHGVVLTPHTMAPIPSDGRGIRDRDILAAGVYNLGFLGVGPGSDAFIDWWWQKTRREAHADPARMMFTDQRWIDFVPGLFDSFILRDPAYNVAYWNLHARDLSWSRDRYLIDGRPLRFFHFSGFDPAKPHLLSKHQGERPRILLSERPAVARICREYLRDLEQAGLDRERIHPYGWQTLPSGLPFDRRMRALYREATERYEQGLDPEPPCPMADDGRFVTWLNEPAPIGLQPIVTRYLYAIHQQREDLRRAFPDLSGRDRLAYLEWVRTSGVVEERIPPSLLPSWLGDAEAAGSPYVPAADLQPGINIAGYFRAEVGIGEAARHLTLAAEQADIPHSTVAYDVTLSRQAHPFLERGERRAPYDVNLLCINADQTAAFARTAGPAFFEGRYTAGYWFWELEQFPASMHEAFDYVDEVWTATRFVAEAVGAIGRRPVHVVPPPIPIPRHSLDVTRDTLGLPHRFMFLFMFDFFSVLERKNPLGAISAFTRAFPAPAPDGPVLVIKTINGRARLNDLEKLRAGGAGRPDVLIVDEYYSAEQKNALVALCDCYVSLHRSEGFGLTMAEAMALGKPVIATAYSGNLDFMRPDNSYLVDYVRTAVPAGCGPYPEGTPWAEPNLDQAAEWMLRVLRVPDEAAQRAERARRDIAENHNADRAAVTLRQRLDEIQRTRRPVGASARSHTTQGESMASPAPAPPASDPTLNATVGALDQIVPILTPAPTVAPGRRFAAPLRLAQRLLYRILRPYWFQQRAVHATLVDTLRQLAEAAARDRAEIEQLREHRQTAQDRIREMDRTQRVTLEAPWTAIHALERGLAGCDQRLQTTATFQTSAAAHLRALNDQLTSVTGDVATLTERLYAAPYMDDRDRFSYTDEQGRPQWGFRAGRASTADPYRGFEDVFRGSEPFIRERLRAYLPLLRPHAPVLEIGCGRGELLDLLAEAGIPANGVDLDEGMVHRCRAKGHSVEHTDGLSYLRAQPEASLPAIFAAQVVEHLSFEDFMEFLALSRTRLRPGGQLIFETVNPHALEAFKTFWTDLTHQRPIFPEVALVWCWLLGFEQARVFFPNGIGELDRDRRVRGEYAVVATT